MKKNKSDINTQIQNICRLCGKKIELNRISLYAPDVQKFIEPDMCFDCIWNKIRNAGIKLLNKSNQKESKTGKWNVVYQKTVAGTVAQEKIDEVRKFLKDNPECHEGIWDISLTAESSDEDYAKYLMLIHETIEEEDLEMEIDEVCKIE